MHVFLSSVSPSVLPRQVTMVFMEQAAYSSSVAPVYNDLDLLVVGYDGTSETAFYPNNLATKDSANTIEVVTISGVDAYEWFNVSTKKSSTSTVVGNIKCGYCALGR